MRSESPLIKIGDTCKVFSGGTPRRGIEGFYGGDIPWAKIGDIETAEGAYLFTTKESITQEGLKSINNKIFKKDTIFLALYGSVGKTAIAGREMSTNQAILGLIPKNPEVLYFKYLKYWLDFSKSELIGLARGVALQNISATIVKEYPIPLPPIEEQHRIVKILDLAQSLIEKRKQAIAYLDDYIKAVFLDMFGDPVSNPKGWERRTLSELLIKIESGHSPVCLDRPVNLGEWGVLKLGAITKCYFIPTENKALPESLTPNIALEVKVGDVLFSRKNTYDLVAASAYVFETPPRLLMSDLIFRLVPKDLKILNPIYLQALISTSSKRKKIQQLAGGAAGSMPNISKCKLLSQQIELPPPDLQEKYSFVVAKVWQLKNQMKTQLFELENNFQVQLQRAFKGEESFSDAK